MKSTYCEYILENILSTSEVGPILALIAPSPFIYFHETIYFSLTSVMSSHVQIWKIVTKIVVGVKVL